ncbi:hypothetical protein RUM44_000203 [Polyplax serrata]|uniref:Uncharacterized protein n=1 Tax=Polyplax serrata TaxID=468196 RepID=A0ABR1B4T1_POLSC
MWSGDGHNTGHSPKEIGGTDTEMFGYRGCLRYIRNTTFWKSFYSHTFKEGKPEIVSATSNIHDVTVEKKKRRLFQLLPLTKENTCPGRS